MKLTPLLSIAAVASLPAVAGAATAFGTTLQGQLVRFNTATPGTLQSAVALTGLEPNEEIEAIDFNADGDLIGISSFSNIYSIDTVTGAASLDATFSTALNGVRFGASFGPSGMINTVTDTDQFMRTDPTTGAVITDTTLAYGAGDVNFGADPDIVHAVFTGGMLFGVDAGLNVTVAINMGTGALTTIGSLDQALTEIGGLDVGPGDVIYGAFQPQAVNESHLFTLDSNDGSTEDRGVISGGIELKTLAVVPTPGASAIAALGGFAMIRRRRN